MTSRNTLIFTPQSLNGILKPLKENVTLNGNALHVVKIRVTINITGGKKKWIKVQSFNTGKNQENKPRINTFISSTIVNSPDQLKKSPESVKNSGKKKITLPILNREIKK